jgi:hypothetical protein
LYVKGKNIIVVFSPKRGGVVIVVLNSVNNARLGYVFLKISEVEHLLREVELANVTHSP